MAGYRDTWTSAGQYRGSTCRLVEPLSALPPAGTRRECLAREAAAGTSLAPLQRARRLGGGGGGGGSAAAAVAAGE